MADIDIDQLNIKIETDSTKASNGLDMLIASMEKLQNAVSSITGLTKISKQIESISKVANINMSGLDEVTNQISKLTNGLKPLETMGKNTINPFLNSLKKLPQIAKDLEKTDLNKFATQIQRVTTAIKPLASEMNKISQGFNAFPQKIQRAVKSMGTLCTASSKTTSSLNGLFTGFSGASLKAGLLYAVMRKMATTMGEWVTESNNYVENLNLFTVSMGDGAEEALKYAETVQSAIGIDMSQFIRNQGIFQQIVSGFGVATHQAEIMSKNLTTLGYDISSFYNIDIESSMTKLKSGIVGELEPLRSLGYALDEATLKQLALNLGIEKSVRDMTQAEKSQLRYVAILQQSKNAMGDMARTLDSPANSMRILEQQIIQLKRALGNMLIPIIMETIPYITALVRCITDGANAIASLFGFELPKFDYSSIEDANNNLGNVQTGLGGISDSAKETEKAVHSALAGFDEINILSKPKDDTDSSSDSGGLGGLGGDLGIELPDYDFLGDLERQSDEIYETMKTSLEKILPVVKDVATAIAAIWAVKKIIDFIGWVKRAFNVLKNLKIVKAITDLFKKFGVKFGKVGTLLGKFAGVTAGAFTVFKNFKDNVYDAMMGTKSWEDALVEMGIVAGVVGILVATLVSPWALIPVAIAGVIGAFIGLKQAEKELMEIDMKKRFGDISLSMDECKSVAEALTTSPYTIKMDVYFDEQDKLTEMYDTLATLSSDLTKDTWLISVGAEVDLEEFDASISTFIEQSKATLEQQAFVHTMTIDLAFSDPNIKAEMTSFVDKYLSESSGELERLGKEMRSTMDLAMADGVLTGDELKTIANLQAEITAITTELANAENKAKLTAISLDFDGVDITSESFTAVVTEAQNIIDEQLKGAEAIRLEGLKFAEIQFDKDGNVEIYKRAIADVQQTFLDSEMKIQLKASTFGLDTMTKAFEKELNLAKPEFEGALKEFFASGIAAGILTEEDVRNMSFDDLVKALGGNFSTALNGLDISTPVKNNIKKILEILKPTADEMEKIAAENIKAGKVVPESITKGLKDYHTLGALVGEFDSISYMVGDYFSDDEEFLNSLTKTETAGKSIDESFALGIANNTGLVGNDLETLLTVITDMIPKMSAAGKELSSAFNNSLDFKAPEIPSSGNIPSYTPKNAPIPKYAAGGFPSQGDMFIANESGPEMVGTIGGRTAVANTNSIEIALENAMRRGSQEQSLQQQKKGDIIIPVYLGNELIEEIIIKAEQSQLVRSNGR